MSIESSYVCVKQNERRCTMNESIMFMYSIVLVE